MHLFTALVLNSITLCCLYTSSYYMCHSYRSVTMCDDEQSVSNGRIFTDQ